MAAWHWARLALLLLALSLLLLLLLLPRPSPPCALPLPPLTALRDLPALFRRPERCGVLATLHTLYQVEEEGGGVVLPAALRVKLSGWLGGDPQLLAEAEEQRVLQVTDRLTGQSTHYNPLRALRPQVAKPNEHSGCLTA
jgi:hypothetical protein